MSIQKISRRTAAAVLLFAALVRPAFAQASVVPLTGRQLVAGSPHVVVAVVEEARTRWNRQRTLLFTDYTLLVEERLRGEAPERVTISVPGGSLDGETHSTSLSTPLETGARYLLFLEDFDHPTLLPITGGWQGVIPADVDLPDLAAKVRGLVDLVETSPEPADIAWLARGEDPGLPAKAWEPTVRGGEKFIVRDPAVAPILFNPLARDNRFSPHDQKQMAYWNLYARDLFRVLPNPSPNWAFGNDISDIAGFPTSAQLQQQFDRPWPNGGFSFTATRMREGHIVECDIALNPAFQWTLDDAASTVPQGPLSFRNTILSNLGRAWGYRGQFDLLGGISLSPVTRDSVMNVKEPAHSLATLLAEDTRAVRSIHPGTSIRDGVISAYSTEPFPFTPVYVPIRTSASSVRAGGTFALLNPVKIENTGTEDLANPTVEVYLVPNRFSLNRSILVKKVNLQALLHSGDAQTFSLGVVTLPRNTRPGTYFFAFVLRDAKDGYQANNTAWSQFDVKIRVKAR